MTYLELQRKLEDGFYTGVTLSLEEAFGVWVLFNKLSIKEKESQVPTLYWKEESELSSNSIGKSLREASIEFREIRCSEER